MPFEFLLCCCCCCCEWERERRHKRVNVPASNYKLCAIYYKMFAPHGGNYHKNKPIYINIQHYHHRLLSAGEVEWSEKESTSVCKAAVLNFIVWLSNFSSPRNRMFKWLFSLISRQLSTPDFSLALRLLLLKLAPLRPPSMCFSFLLFCSNK